MPRCEDCRETGAQPCQGDLVLCQRCSDKRFPPSGSGSEAVCKDVIINDLLCFTVNKMDTLPLDIITKLCTETYMEEEIETAKRLVFDTCKPDDRYIKRKGADKSTANMEDIQRVLHSTAPPSLPTFVSATLHLPAVNLEHVDISVCMQELQIVRQEMKLIRDCSIDSVRVQTELVALRKELWELKNRLSSTPPAASCSAPPAATCSTPPATSSSAPPAASTLTRPKESYANAVSDTCPPETIPKSLHAGDSGRQVERAPATKSSQASRRRGYSSGSRAVARPQSTSAGGHSDLDSEGFRLVQRKKQRSRAVVGTAVSSSLSAVKSRPAEIFVTRLEPDTLTQDVERYLTDNLSQKCAVNCSKLTTKYDGYSSFRVSVDYNAVSEVLSPSFWPCGILVRRFHSRRRSSTS